VAYIKCNVNSGPKHIAFSVIILSFVLFVLLIERNKDKCITISRLFSVSDQFLPQEAYMLARSWGS